MPEVGAAGADLEKGSRQLRTTGKTPPAINSATWQAIAPLELLSQNEDGIGVREQPDGQASTGVR